MGKAIHKTVSIAEIIKRRIPGLHQITEIGSAEIVETYEPKVTGLEPYGLFLSLLMFDNFFLGSPTQNMFPPS